MNIDTLNTNNTSTTTTTTNTTTSTFNNAQHIIRDNGEGDDEGIVNNNSNLYNNEDYHLNSNATTATTNINGITNNTTTTLFINERQQQDEQLQLQQQQQHHHHQQQLIILQKQQEIDRKELDINEKELNFLVLQWLTKLPLTPSLLSSLFDELNNNNLLEKRVSWDGQEYNYDLNELMKKYSHCSQDYLKSMIQSYKYLLNEKGHHSKLPVKTRSLLAPGDYSMVPPSSSTPHIKLNIPTTASTTTTATTINGSLINNEGDHSLNINNVNNNNNQSSSSPDIIGEINNNRHIQSPIIQPQQSQQQQPKLLYPLTTTNKRTVNNTIRNTRSNNNENNETMPLVSKIISRELDGSKKLQHPFPCSSFFQLVLTCQAHKAPAYCFKFDKTSKRFITGADDHMVKIWSSQTGRLLRTLRAHSGDITDISINFDNSLLVSASNDNTLRVWDLSTYAPIHTLLGHESTTKNFISIVSFCPSPDRNLILSSDSYGVCRLWDLDDSSKSCILQSSQSAINCASFNNAGTLVFLASGAIINVWSLTSHPPVLVNTLENHTSNIKILSCNHKSDSIVSGTDDGTVIIWKHSWGTNWNHNPLTFNSRGTTSQKRNIKDRLRTVKWSLDDRFLITADYVVRVWDTKDASLCRELVGHVSEVYVLDCHPFEKRLVMSAGYDSMVILWDIERGVIIKKFILDNLIASSKISDGGFSPDGMQLGVTTNTGKFFLFEIGDDVNSLRFSNTPFEQFFHNDYHSLIRDLYGNVLDEITQTAPHLLPPPLLVNYQGQSYSFQPQPVGEPEKYSDTPQYKEDVCRYKQILEYETELLLKEEPKEKKVLFVPPEPSTPLKKPRGRKQKQQQQEQPNEETEEEEEESVDDFDLPIPSDNSDVDFVVSEEEEEEEEEEAEESDQNEETEEEEEEESNDENQITTRSKSRQLVEKKKNKILNRKIPLTRSRTTNGQLDEIIETLGLPPEIPSDEDEDDMGDNEFASSTTTMTTTNHQNLKRKRGRPPLSASKSIYPYSDNDEEEDEEDQEDEDYIDEDEESGEGDDDSHVTRGGGGKARKKRKARFSLKPQQPTSIKSTNVTPPQSLCPKWLVADSNSAVTSYIPQIGDNVIYFHQGHKKYLDMYPDEITQDIGLSLLWLSTAEECIIKELKYIITSPQSRNPGLHQAQMTLKPVASNDDDDEIKVFYHVSDIPDYLVLASKVRHSLETKWKPGMKFKMYYPDEEKWYIGKIKKITPSDSNYPDSLWERILVRWSLDGNEDRVSPWEIETLDENDNEEEAEEDGHEEGEEEEEEEEIDETSYINLVKKLLNSSESGKSEEIDAETRDSIIARLEDIMDDDICDPYLEPVDLGLYPLYIHYVAHPMDFSTILSRLRNDYYRRVESVAHDAELIMRSAFTYNQPNTKIARNSKLVYHNILSSLAEYMPAGEGNENLNNKSNHSMEQESIDNKIDDDDDDDDGDQSNESSQEMDEDEEEEEEEEDSDFDSNDI